MPTSPGAISNMESNEYHIARVNKDSLQDLAILYAKVHSTAAGHDHFLKKYDTAYTGVENVGFIAYNRDKQPVAYRGVIPCFIQFGKEIVLAAQSADTMTHPEHRHKGLFVKLSVMIFDLCRELGIRLLFAFPNQNAYPPMINHLGWTETKKMSRFSIPAATIWEQAFFKVAGKSREKIMSRLLSDQRYIPNSVIADGYAGINRNEAYMRYKAFTGNYVISTRSADLWVKTGKELIIGDIFLKENGGETLFGEIKSLAKELGLEKISFQSCNDCSLCSLFAGKYQAISSFPVLFKDLGSGLPLEKIKFTFADIDIF